jgi:hypothetical protein
MARHPRRFTGIALTLLLATTTASGRVQDSAAVPAWVAAAAPSHAMSLWKPRHATLNGMPSCTPAFHDTFFVVAPDGLRYPTWHPPVAVDPATGSECAFGHEHGRDPRGSQLWKTKQVQRHTYFDANANGRMDGDEEAWAGLPFGYANGQSDVWFKAQGLATMRHEDHNGHKVEWANDETDITTHGMSEVKDSGVWIGRLGDGIVNRDTGMRCFFLGKVHQGTSTPDAFRHNLHEVMFFQDCRHKQDLERCVDAHDLNTCPDTFDKNARVSLTVLQPFGASGGFTRFAPLCGEERRLDPRDRIAAGHSAQSRLYPPGAGDREIPTRDCIERGFLVEAPRFSGNTYEAWPASLAVRGDDGKPIVEGPDLLFDVNDAVRYYYPEADKARRGYLTARPELAGTDLGYAQDLCGESLGPRRARHNLCQASMAAAAGAVVSWDDPRAGFRGLNRGMYFKPVILRNPGGPTTWYTDPFGGRASTRPFVGALRQELGAGRIDYSDLLRGVPLDPRVSMRVHDDGRGTVHAPN